MWQYVSHLLKNLEYLRVWFKQTKSLGALLCSSLWEIIPMDDVEMLRLDISSPEKTWTLWFGFFSDGRCACFNCQNMSLQNFASDPNSYLCWSKYPYSWIPCVVGWNRSKIHVFLIEVSVKSMIWRWSGPGRQAQRKRFPLRSLRGPQVLWHRPDVVPWRWQAYAAMS